MTSLREIQKHYDTTMAITWVHVRYQYMIIAQEQVSRRRRTVDELTVEITADEMQWILSLIPQNVSFYKV